MRMIRAAVAKDCDIDASVCYDPSLANALYEIEAWWSLGQKQRLVPERAIEFLIDIGCDLEARNSAGCTPLLHTATSYKPQVVTCLRTMIRRGADIQASDSAGRGALHCALAAPHHLEGWITLRLANFSQHSVRNHLFLAAYLYHTQSGTFARDYNEKRDDAIGEEELVPKTTNVWLDDSVREAEEQEGRNAAFGNCECGFKASKNDEEIQTIPGSFQQAKIIACEDFAGVQHTIRHPFQILKMRLRFKLLTLLEAGCDPNVFDKSGATPSHYAEKDGLWPQWTWALGEAGYECITEGNRWKKT